MANAAKRPKLLEDQVDALLDPAVGLLLQAIVRRPEIADSDRGVQGAARRHPFEGFLRALAKDRQLHLAEGAFQAQQEPIVGVARVVNAVFIHQQGVHQPTELQQRVPVAAVSRQPRRLDREDRTDVALANRRQQPIETRPRGPGTGLAQVFIHHDRLLPTQLLGPLL